MLVPCRRREGHVTRNMYTYWRKVMNTFVDFVASREQERVLIDPSRTNIPLNRCLVLNTRAVCSSNGMLALMVGSSMATTFQ